MPDVTAASGAPIAVAHGPRTRRVLVLLFLVVVVLGGAATSALASTVTFRDPGSGRRHVRPAQITFSDADYLKLTWTGWGSSVAVGTGRAEINTCRPSCSAGNNVHGGAVVKLSRIRAEAGRRVYKCLNARSKIAGHTYRAHWCW